MSDDVQDKGTIDKKDLFYDDSAVFGYNAFLSFILSGRGNGKTFAFKKRALNCKGQVVWLRRYEEDLRDFEKEFMADLYQTGLFADDAITIKEHRLYLNGEVKIFFVALSQAFRKKSVSYAGVEIIVFDEFIEARKSRAYLKGEVEMFLDLIETVNRLRVDRAEVRCFCLANKVTFANPYFVYWKIKEFDGRFKKFKNGLIVVENYDNQLFMEMKKKSRFGQLIDGTKYGKYAIDNEVLRDTNDFIAKKPNDAKYLLAVRMGSNYIGFWKSNGCLYCSPAYNPNKLVFAPREDLQEGEFALKSADVPISWMKDLNTIGMLFFEDNMIKDICYNMMVENYK